MAAFCGCCGAEITLKIEACPVCGTPRHGMSPELPAAGAAEKKQPAPNRDQPATCSWIRC